MKSNTVVEDKSSFGLTFGALAPLIRKQLKQRGLKAPKAAIELAEGDAHAIVCLKIHGLLTDSQAEMVRKKLLKRLSKVARS